MTHTHMIHYDALSLSLSLSLYLSLSLFLSLSLNKYMIISTILA